MTATARAIAHTQQHSFTLDPPVHFTVRSPGVLAAGQAPAELDLTTVGIFWRIGGHYGPDLRVEVIASSTSGGYTSVSDKQDPAILDVFADLIAQTRPTLVTSTAIGVGGYTGVPMIVTATNDAAPRPMQPAYALSTPGCPPPHFCSHGNDAHPCTCHAGASHTSRICGGHLPADA